MSSPMPILLFGMPRSGTTWIGKIFDSHPDTLYRHEPDSWGLLNAVPMMPPAGETAAYAGTIRAFHAQLPQMRLTKVAASTPLFPKRYYSPLAYQLFRLSVFAGKGMAKFAGERPVRTFVRARELPRIRIVWKSIESLGRIGVVARALAPCVGIHIVRHPCGYVASVLRGDAQRRFSDTVASSEDLGLFATCLDTDTARRHGLTLDTLKAMHPVERLAWRWVLYNDKALQDIDGEQGCMTLRYEDLCREPLAVAKRLFEFAGLSWNAQSERFVRDSTSKDVGRYYSVVKDPLRAAMKWQDELAADDIDRIYAVVSQTRSGALYPRTP